MFKLKIFLIFVLALSLRLYGLNWDQGNHLHPDERMITMVAEKITWPQFPSTAKFEDKILTFLSADSPLNPKFFAYGSFPLYLLKATASVFNQANYDHLNLIGRGLSALFDSLTVILVIQVFQLLFKSKSGSLIAGLFYALSVLPIQLSHFYAVDTILTFFIIFTLYQLLLFYQTQKLIHAVLSGIGFGLSLATKISAAVLIVSIGATLLIDFFLVFRNKFLLSQNPSLTTVRHRFQFKNIILYFSLIILFATITFFFFEPFAVFDFPTFWRQINEQKIMTRDPFIFPYTLQYVNTLSYLYPLKNIFLWGLGPPLAVLSFAGTIYSLITLIKAILKPGNDQSESRQVIVFAFFIIYFLVIGNFAVKFMRYCLPLYPLLAIFAANLVLRFRKFKFILPVFFIANLIWVFAFLSIYTRPNTRVSATDWIQKNVPAGSTILREHWDDGLPLGYFSQYNFADLPLYDSDSDPQKWIKINQTLQSGNYLIIASNRLYTPLQKLTNCAHLPGGKCYSQTAKYYQNLFTGKLGYQKVAEFSVSPQFLGLTFNDQSADESFTVYDHPKIMLFKNTGKK